MDHGWRTVAECKLVAREAASSTVDSGRCYGSSEAYEPNSVVHGAEGPSPLASGITAAVPGLAALVDLDEADGAISPLVAASDGGACLP